MAKHSKRKPAPVKSPGRLVWLQVILIVVAVFWIYLPALHGGWLWDDNTDITGNTITQSPTGLWKIWFAPGSQLDYYPVKASVQWVQWHLWGNDTLGYHITNVLLHIASALLVWRLLGKLGLRQAWLGGLLFAIHPAQVESVAWIAELKNTLSLPPFVLAICFYLDYDQHHRRRDYRAALGFFLLAMLCKPTMVMFPVVILLYAWWKRDRIAWSDLKASLPFFVVSLALGLMTLFVGVWYRQMHGTSPELVPLGGFLSRLALAGLSIAFYFSKAVLPIGFAPIYPQWPVNPPIPAQFLPWPILLVLLSALWIRRKSWSRHVLLGLGFFLIMLAPFVCLNVGGYTTLTWVMDHFLYIPIIGLIGLFVAGWGRMEQRLAPPLRLYGNGILTVALILLAMESRVQASLYQNATTFWTYAVERNPDSATAQNNLGTALMAESDASFEEAMAHVETAVRLKPDYAEAQYNLGLAFVKLGQLSDAIGHFEQASRMHPQDVRILSNLGAALAETGQPTQATEIFEQAVKINPEDAVMRDNLGTALIQSGRASEAIMQFEAALRLNPLDEEAQEHLARLNDLKDSKPAAH